MPPRLNLTRHFHLTVPGVWGRWSGFGVLCYRLRVYEEGGKLIAATLLLQPRLSGLVNQFVRYQTLE